MNRAGRQRAGRPVKIEGSAPQGDFVGFAISLARCGMPQPSASVIACLVPFSKRPLPLNALVCVAALRPELT